MSGKSPDRENVASIVGPSRSLPKAGVITFEERLEEIDRHQVDRQDTRCTPTGGQIGFETTLVSAVAWIL